MKVIDWCDANGIILPKLTTITGLSRFGHSVWNLWNGSADNFLDRGEIVGYYIHTDGM